MKITSPLGWLGANVLNVSNQRTSANPLGTAPSLGILTAIA